MARWVFSLLAAVLAWSAWSCTTIVVGRGASATGRVLVGHNEDYSDCFMRHGMLPRRGGIPAVFWSEVKRTKGGDTVSHCFYNEHGVIVWSNNGGVMREWDGVAFALPQEGGYSSLTDGGIGYDLRVRMIERAKTAAEGVKILTELVEKFGYTQLSRNFLVADADEAWIVEVLQGRRYVARRVPDDEVAVYPNCLVFNRLRPGDLASKNIVEKGPSFDVIAAYQGPRTWKSPYNLHRWQQLYRIAAGAQVEAGEAYPFSVKPAHPVSADDVKRGLSSHYEGTAVEARPRHPKKTPKTIEPLCRASTQESLVCELAKDPAGTVVHMAVGRPCENPYAKYLPFAGVLPGDTAFGAKAVERLENHAQPPPDRLRVSVFVGRGPRGNGFAAWLRILHASPEVVLSLVDAELLRAGALEGKADVLVVPGGSSKTIKADIGPRGAERIRSFVRAGGGYIGTCAGCCLALDEKADPDRGIGLMPYRRIGSKGHLMLPVAFNAAGAAALGLEEGTREISYSRGPVMEPVATDDPAKCFAEWGTYAGEDHASTNRTFRMPGQTAVVGGTYGKGRVFAIGLHPEAIASTRDIVSGAFRYVTGRAVTFPAPRPVAEGALKTGYLSFVVGGLADAQALLQLESDERVLLVPVTADDIRAGKLEDLDALVLPDGDRKQYANYSKTLANGLPPFAARGGRAFAWGAGVRRLPAGGTTCASAGEAVRRVSDLARGR